MPTCCVVCSRPLEAAVWPEQYYNGSIVHMQCAIDLHWFEELQKDPRITLEDSDNIKKRIEETLFFNNLFTPIFFNKTW